jgi:DNA (cytosine-5)-methyltransferase 1
MFSGYLRALTDMSTLTEGAVPVSDGGPLLAWWICGYGPGELPIVGISTEFAHYYLNEPSPLYAPVMSKIKEKVLLSKVVIECLMDARDREEELSYEDMMAVVEGTIVPDGCPSLTEESLITHAQFVIAQVCCHADLVKI